MVSHPCHITDESSVNRNNCTDLIRGEEFQSLDCVDINGEEVDCERRAVHRRIHSTASQRKLLSSGGLGGGVKCQLSWVKATDIDGFVKDNHQGFCREIEGDRPNFGTSAILNKVGDGLTFTSCQACGHILDGVLDGHSHRLRRYGEVRSLFDVVQIGVANLELNFETIDSRSRGSVFVQHVQIVAGACGERNVYLKESTHTHRFVELESYDTSVQIELTVIKNQQWAGFIRCKTQCLLGRARDNSSRSIPGHITH